MVDRVAVDIHWFIHEMYALEIGILEVDFSSPLVMFLMLFITSHGYLIRQLRSSPLQLRTHSRAWVRAGCLKIRWVILNLKRHRSRCHLVNGDGEGAIRHLTPVYIPLKLYHEVTSAVQYFNNQDESIQRIQKEAGVSYSIPT